MTAQFIALHSSKGSYEVTCQRGNMPTASVEIGHDNDDDDDDDDSNKLMMFRS